MLIRAAALADLPDVLALLFRDGASGALTLARAELLARTYLPNTFGTANGRMALPVNLAQAVTPLGVGWLSTVSGGYGRSLTLLGVLAGLAVWAARERRRGESRPPPAPEAVASYPRLTDGRPHPGPNPGLPAARPTACRAPTS